MEMTSPVIYADSSDAKNETSDATSSGLPMRPSGTRRLISSMGMSCVISVSMNPGATTFTVTLRFATS